MLHTIVGVLSRNFGHGIANLLLNISDRLAGQTRHELLADNQSLFSAEGRKEFLGFVCDGVLSCLGGYSSEKHGSECACLLLGGNINTTGARN